MTLALEPSPAMKCYHSNNCPVNEEKIKSQGRRRNVCLGACVLESMVAQRERARKDPHWAGLPTLWNTSSK